MKLDAKFPLWLKLEKLEWAGQHEDADGHKWGDGMMTVRPRWFRFFFPSYWRSGWRGR